MTFLKILGTQLKCLELIYLHEIEYIGIDGNGITKRIIVEMNVEG